MDNPTGLGLMAEIAALRDEVARLSVREDELNALCLDYQIDLDATRQDIAALKQERDALLKVREAADALAEDVHNYIAWKDALLSDDDYIMRRRLHAYKEARDA